MLGQRKVSQNFWCGLVLRFPLLVSLATLACPSGGTPGIQVSDISEPSDTAHQADLPEAGADLAETDYLFEDGAKEVLQGEFGAPCNSNDDCLSGFCVEGPQGFICTQMCFSETDCPQDYSCKGINIGADIFFLCLPEVIRACAPCLKDFQCPGGRCVVIDGSTRCAPLCENGGCANEALECREVETSGGLTEPLCLPKSGSCDCFTSEQSGNMRTCKVENEFGVCYGFETCDPQRGFVGCNAATPRPEECNGLDDDCDGLADDGLGEAVPCEVSVEGVGTCKGTATCQGPLGFVCNAPTPSPEVCDGLDNDCDGVVDEDFLVDGVYGTLEHCGACGFSCVDTIAYATEKCEVKQGVARCVVAECDPGYFRVGDRQCLGIASLICLPCDENKDCFTGYCVGFSDGDYCSLPCPDEVPEGFGCVQVGSESYLVPVEGTCACNHAKAGQTRPCSRSNEYGTCYGYEVCDPTVGFVGCTAQIPAPETCNGLDDDCNGTPDDGLPTGEPCVNEQPGIGSCQGVLACLGPLGLKCLGPEPSAEVCNYKDDDCDGLTDEDFKNEDGFYVVDEHCGVCGNDCRAAIQNGVGKCELGPEGPQCVVATCEPGYYPVGGKLCLKVPDVVCLPCADSSQCLGGSCQEIGGQKFCTRPCDSEHPCPGWATCTEQGYCAGPNGTCDCLESEAGAMRLCLRQNEFGICYGVETCEPGEGGWVGCNAKDPMPEVCNGIDDDCNGLVDDNIALIIPCENTVDGIGTCKGTAVCKGTAGYVCDAAWPETEACDYVDNDCDGETDEDFKIWNPVVGAFLYLLDEHCGICGNDCSKAIQNGKGRCVLDQAAPRCVVDYCDVGYYKLNDYQCIPAPAFTCQPCDEDSDCFGGLCEVLEGKGYCLVACQGQSDCEPGFECKTFLSGRTACAPLSGTCECTEKNAGAKRLCSVGNAYGTCFGYQVCDPVMGWGPCSAQVPSAEICDGLDNDCNGVPDDGLPESIPCENSNEYGSCAGLAYCLGKAGWVCTASMPGPEVCDYRDNDCNGIVDDPFTAGGIYVDFHNCGVCGRSCALGYPNAIMKCDATKPLPECVVESCEPGYVKINDYQCVPALARLCEPCVVDENCIVEGAKCVPVGDEGLFCGLPCKTQQDCDSKVQGYVCESFGEFSQCVPATGSCSCDGSKVGLQKVCEKKWGDNTCYGIAICTQTGWTECIMPAEQCNLVDDDCNGLTDEGFVDEKGQYSSDENCGKCGNNCTLLVFGNAHGVCNTDVVPFRCGPQCEEGYYDLDDNPNDCECHYLSDTDFPGADFEQFPDALDVNCDGVDGEVANAIFVAKHGDDANPGTRDRPKRTIQAGIEQALLDAKRDVYVATGVYQEAVILAEGIGVYGGYSSDFRVRDIGRYQTAILGPLPSDFAPGAVNCIGISNGLVGSTVFDGFTVFGYHEKRAGRSSYAVYVLDCDSTLRISNNVIVAGSGGPGQRGEDGEDGLDGVAGQPGEAAFDLYYYALQKYGVSAQHCTNLANLGLPVPVSPGGAGGAGQCGSADVSGGSGGERVCPAWDSALNRPASPVASEYGAAGLGPAGGAGGAPGQDVEHQAYACDGYSSFGLVEGQNGADGQPGVDGMAGAGCQSYGAVVGGVWVPHGGASGLAGGPGSGGGGGGSGAGAWVHQSCFAKGFGYDNFGGSGGGGGSGGCQGTGGSGGSGGGGAFAVFVAFSVTPASLPNLAANRILTGYGGPGGDGGAGGVGGSGGPGGQGGAGGGTYNPPDPTYPAFRGGKGGQGGRGGHGGGGGGGCGGPSYGIFMHGVAAELVTQWKAVNQIEIVGTGGPGGKGGFSLANPGGDGLTGITAETNF